MHVLFTESLNHFFHFLHIFNLDIFCMILSQKQVPCEHNSSYSFILILLKLHRCLNHGVKICMCFLCPVTKKVAGYYVIPSETFSVCPFVHRSVCPSIRPSVCLSVSAPTILLPATPPTVLGQSFSNFTAAFRMVWRYAYCFFRILKLFFITFFAFLT